METMDEDMAGARDHDFSVGATGAGGDIAGVAVAVGGVGGNLIAKVAVAAIGSGRDGVIAAARSGGLPDVVAFTAGDGGKVAAVAGGDVAVAVAGEVEVSLSDSELDGIDEDFQESDKVRYMLDSFVGETEAPDSQEFEAVTDLKSSGHGNDMVVDVTHALLRLASTKVRIFESDKQVKNISRLVLPILIPCLYGEQDEDVNDAANTLLWIGHGYVHGSGAAMIPNEAFHDENFEDVKLSMFKIMYPFLYGNNN